jgi:hypothetical protein
MAQLRGGGSYRRSVCIDYLYYNSDGTMKVVEQTREGVRAKSPVAMSPSINTKENITQYGLFVVQITGGVRIYASDSHPISLTVCNLNGQALKNWSSSLITLPDGIFWDGKTSNGTMAPNGRYVAVAATEAQYQVKPFLLFR